jgi:hypothetical protein
VCVFFLLVCSFLLVGETGIDDFDDGLGTMSLSNPKGRPISAQMGGMSLSSSVSFSPTPGSSYIAGAMQSVGGVAGAGIADTGASASVSAGAGAGGGGSSNQPKTARCKRCGLLISRNMEAIEAHMEECGSSGGMGGAGGRTGSMVAAGAGAVAGAEKSYVLNSPDGPITISGGQSKSFGGILRRPELENFGTRIIYRTARNQSGKNIRPREVCALQDSFVDEEGVCYLYEVSVRHCDVTGLSDYVTADVMVCTTNKLHCGLCKYAALFLGFVLMCLFVHSFCILLSVLIIFFLFSSPCWFCY